ncbi:MAG: DUF1295 domain-containing protein [Nakamurella sp.]
MSSTGIQGGDVVLVMVSSLAAVLLLMVLAFVVGRSTGKYSVIDVLWGPGFVLVAAVALLATVRSGGVPELRWLLFAMVACWGLRLGIHLLIRGRGLPEDPRYVAMLDQAAGTLVIVRRVQVPQGLAMWFVSLPVQLGMLLPGPVGWVVWVGLGVYLVGLLFETVGDAQLASFKADPGNRGLVMDNGLWRYTRHPNYFGDACVWVGIFLAVSWSWMGALTILSPLLMVWLLTAKTGKAMTERHLSGSRPGYADYVARTSGFIPLPPRRRPA